MRKVDKFLSTCSGSRGATAAATNPTTALRNHHSLEGAIALANNLTVITHNSREFSRAEGLQIEDLEVVGDEN